MKYLLTAAWIFIFSLAFAESKPREKKKHPQTAKPAVAEVVLPEDSHLEEPMEIPLQPLELKLPKPDEILNDGKLDLEIPAKFLSAYFANRPETFLLDPQKLLSSADFKDHLDFLNHHAADSTIDLFVYLIGKDQEIPSEVRSEELVDRFYTTDKPAIIVCYYLGNPQRSLIYFSPVLANQISPTERHHILEGSIIQALEKLEPAAQLEKFLHQLSIRAYRMEPLTGDEFSEKRAELLPVAAISKPRKAMGDSMNFILLRAQAEPYILPALTIFSGLLALAGLAFGLRRRSRYTFPEFHVEPRLGGAHAAGIGAVISFASAAVPPASQRDQMPDSPRRM